MTDNYARCRNCGATSLNGLLTHTPECRKGLPLKPQAMTDKTPSLSHDPIPPKGCICGAFWTVRGTHKADCPLHKHDPLQMANDTPSPLSEELKNILTELHNRSIASFQARNYFNNDHIDDVLKYIQDNYIPKAQVAAAIPEKRATETVTGEPFNLSEYGQGWNAAIDDLRNALGLTEGTE